MLEAARRRGTVAPDAPVDPAVRGRYAIHEAGHVAIAVAVYGARRVVEVSIDGYGGQTQLDDDPPRDTSFSLDLELLVAFGGTVAEQLVLGSASEGGAHDVANATTILLRQASFGVLPDFPPLSPGALGEVMSEVLKEQLSTAIAERIEMARGDVRRSLHSQADAVGHFATHLEAAETPVGHELTRAIAMRDSTLSYLNEKDPACAGSDARSVCEVGRRSQQPPSLVTAVLP